MPKSIIIILSLLMCINLFSQNDYVSIKGAKTQKPSYIFNKNIIGNQNLMNSLGSSKEELLKVVNDVSVLKDKQNRNLNDYYNLTEYGLIFVDLKDDIKSKTQSELNDFFELDNQADIYVDGYLIESKKYRIALTGIIEIEIIEPNTENGLKNKSLNIWTLTKNERYTEK